MQFDKIIYSNLVICVPREECNGFLIAQDRLNKLNKGTAERAELLEDLKGLVCNKEERKVCCEGKIV